MDLRVGLHLGFLLCTASVLVAWSHVGVPKSVHLEADGAPAVHKTRQLQVGGFLRQAGVTLEPGDQVFPPVDSSLPSQTSVRVVRAVSVTLVAGPSRTELRTAAPDVAALLNEAGLQAGPLDAVRVDGRQVSPSYPLQARNVGADGPVVELHRARPIQVHDRGQVLEVPAHGTHIADALSEAGIRLESGDNVLPDLLQPVQPGAHVYIDRAKDVLLTADGSERRVRTRALTVGELLSQIGVKVGPSDRLLPEPGAPVTDELAVRITRVRQELVVEAEPIAYSTRYLPDDEIEIGQQHIADTGEQGLYKREHLVSYEDGEEVSRVLRREWVERPSRSRVIHYGTKVVPYYVQTGDGSLQYWKVLRVWATWYNPRSAGKPAGHPGYGITSIGMAVRRGIVAVDPRVIPYYTRMYIPGYGVGIAADTGGGIIGNKIDLGFADEEYPDWRTGWVDIYLLGPPPPATPPG